MKFPNAFRLYKKDRNSPTYSMVRKGNVVTYGTFTAGGKTGAKTSKTFATVREAKAFMANPSLFL